MIVSLSSLTDEERKWAQHMYQINREYIQNAYVAVDPNGEKHWVMVCDLEKYNPGKTYETWSPINTRGSWCYFGEPLPEWAGGPGRDLIVTDGFSLEEIEKAEKIMEGL